MPHDAYPDSTNNNNGSSASDHRARRESELLSEIAKCYASLDSIRVQEETSKEDDKKNRNRLLLVTRQLPFDSSHIEKEETTTF
jgi:hypothetical protein